MHSLVSPYAGGGTRTPKGLLPPDFESPATARLWGTTGVYRVEVCGILLRWILLILSTLWYTVLGYITGTVRRWSALRLPPCTEPSPKDCDGGDDREKRSYERKIAAHHDRPGSGGISLREYSDAHPIPIQHKGDKQSDTLGNDQLDEVPSTDRLFPVLHGIRIADLGLKNPPRFPSPDPTPSSTHRIMNPTRQCKPIRRNASRGDCTRSVPVGLAA